MKNTFAKKFTVCALAGGLGVAFTACGDDDSSSPKGTGLPAEVADKAELETYECSMDIIGEKVYVTELEENYECDGEKWFKSYDQTKPSSTESSASKDADGGSSGSSGADLSSNDVECPDDEECDSEGGEGEEGSSDSGKPGKRSSSSSETSVSSSSAAGHAPTFAEDTEGLICGDDAALVAGTVDAENTYVCDADTFRVATKSEKDANRGCTSYNLNEEMLVAGYAVCSYSGKWIASTRTVAGTMTYGGQTYNTIGIGTQMWMAENLNYEYKVNDSTYGNWCYNNSADSCAKYGRLYTWGAAMDSAVTGCGYGKSCWAGNDRAKGVCPDGWHLPDIDEWYALILAVGLPSYAGTLLKTSSGWYSDGNGTDEYGFSARPNGYRHYINENYINENFSNAGKAASFWTSSEYQKKYAYNINMYYENREADHSKGDPHKGYGFAVRCVKD